MFDPGMTLGDHLCFTVYAGEQKFRLNLAHLPALYCPHCGAKDTSYGDCNGENQLKGSAICVACGWHFAVPSMHQDGVCTFFLHEIKKHIREAA